MAPPARALELIHFFSGNTSGWLAEGKETPMSSIKRSLIQQMLAGAATATVALGLLGAAPAATAADLGQDSWWYNNHHDDWQGDNNTYDNNDDGWRYRGNLGTYASYRYSGGRPYYYAPPPIYYHTARPGYASPPAPVSPPALNPAYIF